ncbi:MAG: type 1 glutamine amidotransferase domain-containing protein [Deltaproteobacteria bacterium]|jgi:putative intracellular protease/amidase|nr:type 1 glutamine amidotransferase domain-containing protein [Deltaproteobacteria bacterium]MBW2498269.1 type 1 glutamine amidotransferase domain-containing protein [Deltaproteobacteria bacterium]
MAVRRVIGRRRWLLLLATVLGAAGGLGFGLPALLHAAGLHPEHERGDFDLAGRRALLIATNQDVLGETNEPTGVFLSEVTEPYYDFLDARMAIDVASVRGGRIPIDPQSLLWFMSTPSVERYRDDTELQRKLENSLPIAALDLTAYDIVFFAGGWGAAYDLAYSDELGRKVTEANAAGVILGGVCHGPLGLLRAKAADGSPLVAGRRLTAVTDKQVRELGVEVTPQHPERELRAAGALFESNAAFRDMFATHVVVDGNLVTGQNQNSGGETAQRMMRLLDRR